MSTDNQELNSALYFACSRCAETKHKSSESSIHPGVCTACVLNELRAKTKQKFAPVSEPQQVPEQFTCTMCGNNYHRSPQSSEAGTCEKCAMIIWGLPPKPEQDQNTETTYLKRPLPKLATKEYMTEFAIEWCRAKFNDHTDRHAKLGLLIDFISDYHS